MLLVVQKRFAIFAILFGIAAGYYRHGSMDPAPPNYRSPIERPKPYLQAPMTKWGEEKRPMAKWIEEKRHIKDIGNIGFRHMAKWGEKYT